MAPRVQRRETAFFTWQPRSENPLVLSAEIRASDETVLASGQLAVEFAGAAQFVISIPMQ